MPSKRTSTNLVCLSAIALICTAPAFAQTSSGSMGGSSASPQTSPGSMGGSSASPQTSPGSMGGSSTSPQTSTGGMGGSSASAQTSGASATGSQTASAADKKFVQKAMQGGMAEVQLGQLATQKASSSDVKDFGQKMVDDHTKLNDQMKPVGESLGITPPASLDAKHQALMTKLQGLSGAAFDKAYMTAMVSDHKEDDKDFKSEETSGKDPQVKDAATQGEPVIAQHLQMAQDIQSKLK